MIDTRMVSGVSASFKSSKEICPLLSTERNVMRKPCSSKKEAVALTLGCSTAVVMIWFPFLFAASAVPISAILLDSVPPEVMISSFGSTFKVAAIFCLASLI